MKPKIELDQKCCFGDCVADAQYQVVGYLWALKTPAHKRNDSNCAVMETTLTVCEAHKGEIPTPVQMFGEIGSKQRNIIVTAFRAAGDKAAPDFDKAKFVARPIVRIVKSH